MEEWIKGRISLLDEYFSYDPDGIREIDNEQLTIDNAEYYDLQGRKLSRKPVRGIYIENGKKKLLK